MVGRASRAVPLLAAAFLLALVGLQAGAPRAEAICFNGCATLSFSMSGTGTFEVQTTDSSYTPNNVIDCKRSGGLTSGTCSHTYTVGQPPVAVTIYWVTTYAPGTDWSGSCGGSAQDASYSLSTTTTIGVGADLCNPSLLTVTKLGSGSGTVTSSPVGINCGSSCSDEFATNGKPGCSGTCGQVTLSETPLSGSAFGGWAGGGCTGTAATCLVTVTGTTDVSADFTSTATPPPTAGPSPTATPKPTGTPSPAGTPTPAPIVTPGPGATPTPRPAPGLTAAPGSPNLVGVGASLLPVAEASGASSAPAETGTPAPAASASPSSPAASGGGGSAPIILAVLVAGILAGAGLFFGLRGRRSSPPT